MQTSIKGKSFEVASEPSEYWGWISEGRYDHEWKVYDAYLRPEHTFLDLGAWVGGHSLYASTIAKKVIAVEPDPVAFAIAFKNLRMTEIHVLAISSYEGEMKLGRGWLGASTTRANPNAGGGIGAWDEAHTCTVPCTTLRKFCQDIPDPLFIKIDVEGSEEEILKDADFFKVRQPVVLVELHPFWWKDPVQTWIDFAAVKALYKSAHEVPHPNSNTWVLQP